MTAPTPWSIKGIDADARQAAKDAARRDGMTLGAWITKRVIEVSGSDAAPATDLGREAQHNDGGARRDLAIDDEERADALEARLEARIDAKLEAIVEQVANFGASADRVASAVETNGVRVEIAERAAELVAAAVDRRLAAVAPTTPPQGEDAALDAGARETAAVDTSALDTAALGALLAEALSPIAARLDALSEGVAATSNASEHALEELAERVDGAARRHEEMSTAVGGAVAALAARLADVEAALAETTRAVASSAPEGPQLSSSARKTFGAAAPPSTPVETPPHTPPDPLSSSKPAARAAAPTENAATKKSAGAPDLKELRARLHGRSEANPTTSEENTLRDSLSTVRDLLPETTSPLPGIDEEINLDAEFDAAQAHLSGRQPPAPQTSPTTPQSSPPSSPPPVMSIVDDQSGWDEIERQTGLKPVDPLDADTAPTALGRSGQDSAHAESRRTDETGAEIGAEASPENEANPSTLTDRLGKLAGRLLGGAAKGEDAEGGGKTSSPAP